MVLWRFTYREVANRRGRALLTLLSLAISMAAVVSVMLAVRTTRSAYQQMYEAVTGRAALEIAAEGGGFYPAEALDPLRDIPGVEILVPTIQTPSKLFYKQDRLALLAMGVDPATDEAVRDYALVEGEFFTSGAEGCLLEVGFARALGIRCGDEVSLLAGRGRKPIRVLGLLAPRGAARFNQGGVIFLPLSMAQSLFAKPGMVNLTSVVISEGANQQRVAAEIERRLPVGLSLRTPQARTQLAADTLRSVESGLDYAKVLSVLLALFMIFNTFLMNVGERRKQLAILRAIGATQRQIVRTMLAEGLAMGVLGTALGCLLGVGGAYLLTRAMSVAYGANIPALRIHWEPFALAAVLGPAVALLASYVPARLAGAVSPLEGMRPNVTKESQSRLPFGYVLAAVAAFLLTGAWLAGSVVGWLPLETMVWAGALFTAAFVMLIPIVLAPVASAGAAALRPLLGVEAAVAQRQLLRRRVRTTLTIGVLYMAVSTAIAMGTTIMNNVREVRNWHARTMSGDFFVRALQVDPASGTAIVMPEELGAQIRAIDGVTNVDTIRFVRDVKAMGQSVLLVVRDFTDKDTLPIELKEGSPEQLRERLARGEAVISTVLAQRHGLHVGDSFPMRTRHGERQITIAGTTNAYLVGGSVIYMQGAHARRLLDIEGVDVFVVQVARQKLAEAESALQQLCDQHGVMLHSFADLRRMLDAILDGVIGSLWGLVAIGFVMAAFGVANTLTINVLEQTGELAMLRVVAMTRWQVRRTILGQAAIIGLIGLTTGAIGGLSGSYVMNLCSLRMLGHVVAFSLNPIMVVACFLIGLAVVLLAAWAPAERAARLNLLLALHYE